MTRHSGPRQRRTRPGWLPLAALVLAGLAMSLVACGGDGSDGVATAGGDTTSAPETTAPSQGDPFKFAQCMRDNGIENWPDPEAPADGGSGGSGGGPARVFAPEGVGPDEIRPAMEQCRHLLPNGGNPPAGERDNAAMLAFAQCMRENGVPNFPDPPAEGGNMGVPRDIDPESPEVQAAFETCREHLGAAGGRVSG